MRKQNRLFNTIIAIFTILSLLFITLGFIKSCGNILKQYEEERATIPITQVEIPIVKDKQTVWYLDLVRNPTEYYVIFNNEDSLKGQLAECVNIIYTSFNVNFNSENFTDNLFGNMNEQYIGPTQLFNSIMTYNRKNNIDDVKIAILPNDISNLDSLEKITNNNYPIIIWYTVLDLDEKAYFDGYAYWDYAKPLIIYSIDENQVYAIDPKDGYINIDKNNFENNWSKCGNRAVIIG